MACLNKERFKISSTYIEKLLRKMRQIFVTDRQKDTQE